MSAVPRRSPINLLVVCSEVSALNVVEKVFQHECDSKFTKNPKDVGVRFCQEWRPRRKGHPALSVVLTSQTHVGPTSCIERLSQLSALYRPDLLVMLGTCAGVERQPSSVQHGSVFVARKAAVERGLKASSSDYYVESEYAEVTGKMMTLVNEFVHRDSQEWVGMIPPDLQCPSPRYARELVLDIVRSRPDGVEKETVLKKCEHLESFQGFGAMSRLSWGTVMEELVDPNGLVEAGGELGDILRPTKQGQRYIRNAFGGIFPRRDSISLTFETMGTVQSHSVNPATEAAKMRHNMAASRLMAVDREAYHFMKHGMSRFPEADSLVIKGIVECIAGEGQIDCFEKSAAAAAAAFLKYFIADVHRILFRNIAASPVETLQLGFANEDEVSRLLAAVRDCAASRAVVLALAMGFTLDEVTTLIHDIVHAEDHIIVIFETKAKENSRQEAAVQLLEACKQVDNRIYLAVVNQLQSKKD